MMASLICENIIKKVLSLALLLAYSTSKDYETQWQGLEFPYKSK